MVIYITPLLTKSRDTRAGKFVLNLVDHDHLFEVKVRRAPTRPLYDTLMPTRPLFLVPHCQHRRLVVQRGLFYGNGAANAPETS